MTLATAGLVVLQKNKILLAFSTNKNAWYLPGGKIDHGETSVEALIREIEEELGLHVKTEELIYFCHTTAPAYGEGDTVIMEQDCYLYQLEKEIKPRNEISEVKYFSREEYAKEPAQVPGVIMMFDKLKKEGKI